MAHDALLECAALSARYGRIAVCRDMNFTLNRGEVLAVLGPNGAGKTSMLGSVSGIVSGEGSVRLLGQEINQLPADRRAKLGLRLVPEDRGLFPDLTVRENLRLGARLAAADQRERLIERAVTLFPVLGDRWAQQAGSMSGGEQQMLAVGKAIAGDPSVLMLDEPTQGLAPGVFDILRQAILALRDDGLGIVLVEQRHAFARSLSDRTAVLVGGRVVYESASGEDIDRDELMRLYAETAAAV